MAYLLEKDKSTSDEIVRLFEKVRVAYLSAQSGVVPWMVLKKNTKIQMKFLMS